jgi:O-antigen ligase
VKASWLLIALIILSLGARTLGYDTNLFRGMTMENALVWLVFIVLVLEMTLGNPIRLEGGRAHVAFITWIGYAVISCVTVALFADYQGYGLVKSGMRIKNHLFDHYLLFLAFFFGARSTLAARRVLMALMLTVCAANLLSVLDAQHVIGLGITEIDGGRVQGIMAEANQTGVLVATFLPACLAVAAGSRGAWRLAWSIGCVALIMAVLLGASRGGVVGIVAGAGLGAMLFKRYVPVGRTLGMAVVAMFVVVLIGVSVSTEFRSLLVERFITQSTASGTADLTSGRSMIWGEAIGRAMELPWTPVTGMGWDAYATMAFKRAPHNTYLGLWFDLGLVGVFCFLTLVSYAVRCTLQAARVAVEDRFLLFGCAAGIIGMAVAIFFVDIYLPWPYIWAFVALVTRLSLNLAAEGSQAVADVPAKARPAPPRGARFGWRAGS